MFCLVGLWLVEALKLVRKYERKKNLSANSSTFVRRVNLASSQRDRDDGWAEKARLEERSQ